MSSLKSGLWEGERETMLLSFPPRLIRPCSAAWKETRGSYKTVLVDCFVVGNLFRVTDSFAF